MVWLEFSHIYCDGLSSEILSHRTMCYEDKGCGEDEMETHAQEKNALVHF